MTLSFLLLTQALTAFPGVPASSFTPSLDSVQSVGQPGQAWAGSAERAASSVVFVVPDTVKQKKSVDYSGGYAVRADIHKFTSYATGPLLLAQYITGEELLNKGSAAPNWAKDLHQPLSMVLGGVFIVNTVTGVWNLRASRSDPAGRTRRTVHGVIMLLADAGFAYAASIAPSIEEIDERIAQGQRGGWTDHKKVAMASIGVATAGYLMMYLWKD